MAKKPQKKGHAKRSTHNNEKSVSSTGDPEQPNKNNAEIAAPDIHNIPPKGLRNLGNTCFFNSVSQCIIQTHPVSCYLDEVNKIKELVVPKDCVVNVSEIKVDVKECEIPLPDIHMNFVLTFTNFITEFKCGRSPNPSPVFDMISRKVPRFRGYQQQDAHELLRYFLDALRQEEIDRFKKGIVEYLEKEKVPEKEVPLLSKAILKCVGVPILDSVFGGTLLQTIKCSECNHVSATFEPFLDLSLPLARSDIKKSAAPVTLTKHQQKKAKKAKKKKDRKNKDDSEEVKNEGQVEEAAEDEKVENDQSDPADDENGNIENKEEMNGNTIEEIENGLKDLDISSNNDCISLLVDEDEKEDDNFGIIGALKRFISVDILCASNAYECEKCCTPHNKNIKGPKGRKTVQSLKRYMIFSPPPILTLHLKRFEQTHTFNRTVSTKINGHIDFPMVLDLGPFCAKSEERVRSNQTKILYSLYGVVCHSGNLSGGHYIAYVRSRNKLPHVKNFFYQAAKESFSDPHRLGDLLLHKQLKKELNGSLNSIQTPTEEAAQTILEQLQQNSRWYCCSDSNVKMVTEAKVKFCEAYILFYERVF